MDPNENRAKRRIAVIGECMIELSEDADGQLRQGFAGDTANTAVSLARLLPAPKARVSYVTAVGEDDFSLGMIGGWEAEGLDTSLVRRIPGKLPGLYWISTDAAGERSFHYWRSQSAAREMLSGDYLARLRDALDGFELICLSGITLAILPADDRIGLIELLAALRAQGSRIVFDTNYRSQLWSDAPQARQSYCAMLNATSTAFSSFEDEQALFGDDRPEVTCDRLRQSGIAEAVVRNGAQPCLVQVDGRRVEVPAPAIGRVVDTSGAGDAFDAAYLAARCLNHEPAEAVAAGHRLAAVTIAHRGALLPRREMPALADLLI